MTYLFSRLLILPESTALCWTATSGEVAVDDSTRSSVVPFSRTRNVSYRRLSTPSSSSVDCGTPRSAGPSSRDAVVDASLLPDSDCDTPSAVTTPSQARVDQDCGTAGRRRTEVTITPDRPARRKETHGDATELSSLELSEINEGFRESSVCI